VQEKGKDADASEEESGEEDKSKAEYNETFLQQNIFPSMFKTDFDYKVLL
jgi:hypothetical protein